jgi:ribosomal-protein-alanine N-acetyltransferase
MTMNNIIILPAEEKHLDRIIEIENKSFSCPWSKNDFLYPLYNPEVQSLFSAVKNNEVVGYICIFHLFEEGELLNIAVTPELRCLGIAQMLIDKMCETLKEKSVSRVTLEVRESNTPAKSLYIKNGFSAFAIRKNYYKNPLENAIVMEKHI